MKLRLVGLALLCGASCNVRADAENDRIAAERAAANAKLVEKERECGDRFVVAPCVEEARHEHRDTMARLRQQDLQLGESRRRAAAEARRKAIADKVEAQQSRVTDAQPEEPRVRVRRTPTAPAPAASRPTETIALPRPAGNASAGESRTAVEQRNQERYASRQREAQAHREAVERRNAERARQGKSVAPLPSASGASAPR